MTDDDLRIVRGLVARVREEQPDLEPSPAITAQLLLAAREHAPRRAGFWVKARAYFLPATALAAAALALLVWSRRDPGGVEPTVAPPPPALERTVAPEPAPPAIVDDAEAPDVEAAPAEAQAKPDRAPAPRQEDPRVPRRVAPRKAADAPRAPAEKMEAGGVTARLGAVDDSGVDPDLAAARAAAAKNDCAAVLRIAEQVRTRDASYHDQTFARDAALAACLRDRAGAAP